MTTVRLYRDFEYGALAVMAEGHRLTIIEHGFADIVPVRGLLERVAEHVTTLDGREVWKTKTNAHVVRETIDQMLREGGYTNDPLGERAILSMGIEEAARPDLPAATRMHVSEAVERAIAGHLNTAVAMLGELGPIQSQTMEAFTRPNAPAKRRLPFIHAQAVVSVGQDFAEGRCADVCKRFREALRPLKEALVRATATLDDGVLFLEVGIRPTAELVETFEAGALPAFETTPVRGYRDATFVAYNVTAEAVDRLRERALTCSAALEVEQLEGGAIRVRIPSVYEDSHTGDPAFSARANWLAGQIGAEMTDVGDFCEDVDTKKRAAQAVNENVAAAKNKALVEINNAMRRLSQILDSLDPNGRAMVADTIATALKNRAFQFEE